MITIMESNQTNNPPLRALIYAMTTCIAASLTTRALSFYYDYERRRWDGPFAGHARYISTFIITHMWLVIIGTIIGVKLGEFLFERVCKYLMRTTFVHGIRERVGSEEADRGRGKDR